MLFLVLPAWWAGAGASLWWLGPDAPEWALLAVTAWWVAVVPAAASYVTGRLGRRRGA